MLSLNMLKSQSAIMGISDSDNQFPTFDAESKSTKIPKSHYCEGG